MFDNLSKFGSTVSSKNKAAQLLKDSSEKIVPSLKRKPNLSETVDDKHFVNKIFTCFLHLKIVKK